MKDYEDEAFDELEKAQQRKVATGVTDGSKTEANSTLSALKLALEALNKLRDFPGAFDECLAATKALRVAIAMESAPALASVQEPVAIVDGKWYWVRYDGLGKTYEAPALYRESAKAFYSVEFSGIPTRQVEMICEYPLAAQPAKQERPQNCGTGYCSCIECVMEQEQGEPVAWPTLTADEREALERFNETYEDGEGYDVPKSMMKHLAELGVLYSAGFGRYGFTEFGHAALNHPQPTPKQEQGEPVATARFDGTLHWVEPYGVGLHRIQGPLYTTPQQRKPLTFEQVEDCFPSHPPAGVVNGEVFVSAQWLHDFATNIQKAAHGIKE
jgi:hypothetical protein